MAFKFNIFKNVFDVVRDIGDLDNRYVNVAGDTMTGLLTLSGAPTSNLHAATKLYVDNAVGAENLWDRSDSTLTPHTANDSINIGSGTFTTTGTITGEHITISSPTPILVLKDSTYTGDDTLGFIEWRDKNNTRLGFFGNASSGDDDLYWKNESTGGHIKIQTTGAGEFQIFANTTIKGSLLTAMTGTVTTDGSADIVGDGTNFANGEIAVGDAIKIESSESAGYEIFTVAVITDDTHLELDSAYAGSNASGLDIWSDSDLFKIDNGDGTNLLTMDKSGDIDAQAGDITTEGRIIATGGGQTGKFLTGSAGYTVFAYTGGGWDIRAGDGTQSAQNVLRVDNSGDFDFYSGNLSGIGTLSAGATTVTSLDAGAGAITTTGGLTADTLTLPHDTADPFKIYQEGDNWIIDFEESDGDNMGLIFKAGAEKPLKIGLASGSYSGVAFGSGSASGFGSVAMGDLTAASGRGSVAFGSNTIASGNYSVAMSYQTTASGDYSVVMGYYTIANAYQTVLGRFSTDQGHATNWVATDDLFKIGIGASIGARADAFRLLKNGESHWETDSKHYYGLANDVSFQFNGDDWVFNSENITANDEVHFTNFDKYTFDNILIAGDGGTTNYAQFASDGELTFAGTARVIKSRWFPFNALKAPGTKPATFKEWGISGVWEFSDATDDTIVFNLQVPNDMDITVAPSFLIGWSTATTATDETCTWQLEYLYTAAGEDTTAAAQETLTVDSNAIAQANGLIEAEITGIDLPGATDACMHCRLKRLGAGGNDDLTDTAELHGICIKYTSDKLGEAT